ncbi:MAG: alanine--tRNA ligase [Rhodospirillaceae bacterium]|nr:alanine--tRNA ligase [Rhodospirillaceae bacterium]|tara:strand:+ start:72 stop:2729 length:2658 start_codon:yes stop_codon:yes gene_type:complete
MISVNDVRSTFLDYFRQNGHEVVASSPLVPHNDPTLLFTNAGMVQFKNVFTGAEKSDYDRATTAQKCVRAGGKHNDLDNVGYTARHHTFFEMLGNFSFGDYFKDQAIEFAWNLTTKEYGLKPDNLLITVHSSDEDAAAIWRKVTGFDDSRIIRIPTLDNFWSMGDTGPCGPCSEIFIDQGPDLAGGPPGSPDEDGDRFLEFWNLVFMQYEQITPDERVDLPKPSIDTGMGLERMAAILQGVNSNFDTDLFQTLIRATEECIGREADGDARPSFNVIADHLRTSAFLIADGVLPSNEGRGYVLRRIMRRAMRHASILGAQDPVMHRLVPTLTGEMGQAFPELIRGQALITETLKLEETRFQETLERGLRLLADETDKLADGADLPGDVAFRLYDTFGFPLDLTEDALRREGRSVDHAGFDTAMAEQKAKARAAWSGSGDATTEQVWFDLREEAGATEFLGYGATTAQGQIVAVVLDGNAVDAAGEGDDVALVLNQTPFYGESGGQMGDTGMIETPSGRIAVSDTQKKLGDMHVHVGKVVEGTARVGHEATLAADIDRRDRLRGNHSATHLLHEALRRRLGDHVTQKGSLVAPERLRFDISYPKPVEDGDLAAVEAEVNAAIRRNAAVATRLMTTDEAIEQGALALFGEKYGDEVRVVSMGAPTGDKDGEKDYFSTELCGGTHVERTGDIGAFKIVSESAVASGVRRIEALTGEAAMVYLDEQDQRVRGLSSRLKTTPADLETRVKALVEERRKLEREVADLRRKLATGGGASTGDDAKEIAGVKVLAKVLEGVPGKDLRGMADQMKQQLGSGIVVLVATDEGKAAIVAGVTDDLTERFNAVDLVKIGVTELGGRGGGGRPDMAQGGGPDAAQAAQALAAIEQKILG